MQACRSAGDQYVRAELLRLHERAPGERPAGNAGRKAEIVLYFRAGARLTAGSKRLEYQHAQSLGGGVNGRREACRSRADDDEVANDFVIDLRIHAQARGNLFIAGILQDLFTAADHHRNVVDADMKTLEQRRGHRDRGSASRQT